LRVEELFYRFPREVGYRRVVVNNKNELVRYVELAEWGQTSILFHYTTSA